ncbi:MAG: hypothetical protein GXW99_08970 [Clostridiales bacterium]|nr:hypothetical protein [Clostridiales bacterium]
MKKRDLLPAVAAALILIGVSAGSWLRPDQSFSANENRYLQQLPHFTGVISGEFSAAAERYESDQVLWRDMWITVKSEVQRLIGKRDIGGAYLGEDGYYLEKVTEENFRQTQYEKNLQSVAALFHQNSTRNNKLLLVPSAGTVLTGKLPPHSPFYDADSRYEQASALLGSAQIVDVRNALSEDTAQVYYRTDHHWTTEGAFVAYEVWCRSHGILPGDRETFGLTNVSDDFRGSLYSKVLLPSSVYDSVQLAEKVNVVSTTKDGISSDSLYDREKLSEKDKYAVFFGGNYARVDIQTGLANRKRLLVIKDSFANSFIPFLTGDYQEIVMIDLRYYKDSIAELTQEENFTDILVLYEMSNFAKDKNLFKLDPS